MLGIRCEDVKSDQPALQTIS